jgi:hypothetical protein
VRAVLVSKDAVKEDVAERESYANRSLLHGALDGVLLPVGRSFMVSRQTGEEVFLSQLHRRALLLNEGFQNRIVQILSQHETVSSVEIKASDSLAKSTSESTISDQSWRTTDAAVVIFECVFADCIGKVEVHQAPIKT